ncbi:MAG TPA: hypothetical protein VF097_10340 [Actinomycetota bacterium]
MAEKETAREEGTDVPTCPVSICPVGMMLTLAGQAKPEVVEHLLNAGRELIMAATVFLNARADAVSESPRLERIDVD